jgi:hypothetical protein
VFSKFFQRVSEAPTNPQAKPVIKRFDVADLYRGPVAVEDDRAARDVPLDEKLRQAYFWIVNHAIISPFYDIEYNDGPIQSFKFGDTQSAVTLPSGQSYSSFVLLPLLTFAVRAKCLLVGGPGRGKTSSAVLMGGPPPRTHYCSGVPKSATGTMRHREPARAGSHAHPRRDHPSPRAVARP